MAYFEPTGCMFQIFAFHTFVFFFHQTPQSPLVRPAAHDELAIDNYALGTNAVVAVISYTVSYATCGVWGGGGGTSICKLYRYVLCDWEWFLRCSVIEGYFKLC